MPVFHYTALVSDGGKTEGSLKAGSRQEALKVLANQGMQPVVLEVEASGGVRVRSKPSGGGAMRLSSAQIRDFTEDLADLLEAGLQLEPALKSLENRDGDVSLQKVAAALREQVREGTSFSYALKQVSKSFNELYRGVVEAGELSGALGGILRRQSSYLSAQIELSNRVRSAMIYPSFLILAGMGLMIIVSTVLIPNLMSLFEGRELPFLTRMLMLSSEFLMRYWWVLGLIIILGGVAFKYVVSKPDGRLWWHRKQLTLWLFGDVLRLKCYTQMTYTLGTLLDSGVPLLKALELTNRGTPNDYVRGLFGKVTQYVEDGTSLSYGLKQAKAMDEGSIDMIRIGEETGKLGGSLFKIARRYEKKLTLMMTRLTAFISPAIISVMALLVGLAVYSILDAIFESLSGLRVR